MLDKLVPLSGSVPTLRKRSAQERDTPTDRSRMSPALSHSIWKYLRKIVPMP